MRSRWWSFCRTGSMSGQAVLMELSNNLLTDSLSARACIWREPAFSVWLNWPSRRVKYLAWFQLHFNYGKAHWSSSKNTTWASSPSLVPLTLLLFPTLTVIYNCIKLISQTTFAQPSVDNLIKNKEAFYDQKMLLDTWDFSAFINLFMMTCRKKIRVNFIHSYSRGYPRRQDTFIMHAEISCWNILPHPSSNSSF